MTALRRKSAICLSVLGVAVLWWNLVKHSLGFRIAADEYFFSTCAWSIAHGYKPMVDFYCAAPGLPFLLAAVCRWVPDGPASILAMRFVMHGVLLLFLISVWMIQKRFGLAARIVSVFVALCYVPFLLYSLDIRIDPLGVALTFFSLALLCRQGKSREWMELASGALLTIAAWVSIKVLVYGVAIPLAALVSKWRKGESPEDDLVQFPGWYIGGGALSGLAIAAYWQLTYGFSAWVVDYATMVRLHETVFSHRPAIECLRAFFSAEWWIFIPAIAGIFVTTQRVLRRNYSGGSIALLLLIPFSLMSVLLQEEPYEHSVLPLAATLIVLSGRFAIMALSLLSNRISIAYRAIGLMVSGLLVWAIPFQALEMSGLRGKKPIFRHLRRIQRIVQLTSPSDRVFDGVGLCAVRPSACYYIFLDIGLINSTIGDGIPASLLKNECVVWVNGYRDRFSLYPPSFRQFLTQHYVDCDNGIALWAKQFRLGIGRHSTFDAVKSADYYVRPAGLGVSGGLAVDGKKTSSDVFHLMKGTHDVQVNVSTGPFVIIWLPRNRTMFAPTPEAADAVGLPSGK